MASLLAAAFLRLAQRGGHESQALGSSRNVTTSMVKETSTAVSVQLDLLLSESVHVTHARPGSVGENGSERK